MRVLILTSSVAGTASHALPLLFNEAGIEVAMVILNEGKIANKKKHYLTKIKKVFKIGLFGALNGIRMRKWFSNDTEKFLPAINLEIFCQQNDIPFERTPSINCDRTRELFRKASADVGLSLGNSFIAKSVFSICRYGMINIHGEILPDYQNAQSIIWQLYNGSAETGFTIHKINQKIDQGNILYQQKFPIIFKKSLKETVSFNCAQITQKACAALVQVIKNFSFYNNNSVPQGEGTHYTTPSRKQFQIIKKQFSILKNQKALQQN